MSTLFIAMLHTYLSMGVVVWDLIIAGNGALAGLIAITGAHPGGYSWQPVVAGRCCLADGCQLALSPRSWLPWPSGWG